VARFKFRLEPILKVRKLRQEQREREVAEQVARLLRTRRELQTVSSQIEQQYEDIRESGLVGPLRVEAMVYSRQYLNHLHQLREGQLAALTNAERLVAQAKKELAEAKKQTDIMAKLKDRAEQRFLQEARRKETASLDDLANSRFAYLTQQAG